MRLKLSIGISFLIIFYLLTNSTYLYMAKTAKPANNLEIRLGLGFYDHIETFDPQVIQVTGEAELALNLYAPLIDYNDFGQIKGVIAESVIWDKGEFKFKIRKGIKTNNGHMVTNKDAFFSLQRLIEKRTSTHGQLSSLICKKGINPCSGLRVDENYLYIKPRNNHLKKYILPTLAALDHVIIPTTAFEETGDKFKITNYSETTGAYYVEHSEKNGEMIWKKNKFSPRYNTFSFEKVKTVPIPLKDGIKFYNNDKVDIISMTTGLTKSDFKKVNADFSYFETDLIRLKALSFLKKAMYKSNNLERIDSAIYLKKVFFDLLHDGDYNKTSVYFPESSFGFLDSNVHKAFNQESLAKKVSTTPPKFKIAVAGAELKRYQEIKQLENKFEFIEYDNHFWSRDEANWPDAVLLDIDSLFHEDISLLYYGFKFGIFGEPSSANMWLNKYLELSNTERKQELRKLQDNFLREGRVIPFGLSPYILLGKPNLKYDLPKSMAGTLMWKITLNN